MNWIFYDSGVKPKHLEGGEIKVPLLYLGDEPVSIQAGQRIAQGMLIKCHRAEFEKRDGLEETDRGDGGFGSTGEK